MASDLLLNRVTVLFNILFTPPSTPSVVLQKGKTITDTFFDICRNNNINENKMENQPIENKVFTVSMSWIRKACWPYFQGRNLWDCPGTFPSV